MQKLQEADDDLRDDIFMGEDFELPTREAEDFNLPSKTRKRLANDDSLPRIHRSRKRHQQTLSLADRLVSELKKCPAIKKIVPGKTVTTKCSSRPGAKLTRTESGFRMTVKRPNASQDFILHTSQHELVEETINAILKQLNKRAN